MYKSNGEKTTFSLKLAMLSIFDFDFYHHDAKQIITIGYKLDLWLWHYMRFNANLMLDFLHANLMIG